MKIPRSRFLLLLFSFAVSIHAAGQLKETSEPTENSDTLEIRSLSRLLEDLAPDPQSPSMNIFGLPKIFTGYREVLPVRAFDKPDSLTSPALFKSLYFKAVPDTIERMVYTVAPGEENPWDLADLPVVERDSVIIREVQEVEPLPGVITGEVVPQWMKREAASWQRQLDLEYLSMVNTPSQLDYAYWNLPVPPTMPAEDYSFEAFLRRQHLNVNINSAVVTETEIEKKHWLHVVNAALQFSQAYLSKNWYQGGNNYLALLGNFLWDVQLNPVFHTKLMFQSTLSYKLGLNSTEDNQLHKYSISEDLFQYNLKCGYKAAEHWYYSFTTQFKTQMLNNYPSDSMIRTASFLTPGVLTLGLGMTYTTRNAKKTIDFTASISPLSYNLKTAIDPKVDHLQFGIDQDKKLVNEFGSTAEVTFNWKIWDNVAYRTRLFLFTDYKQSNADWQNTLELQFNKFFSTQLYINLRYDSTADLTLDPRWKRWMLKEILSVGLSYTFSTKI